MQPYFEIISDVTAIITPRSILEQWVREIYHHFDEMERSVSVSVSVVVYPGVTGICDGSSNSVDVSLSHVDSINNLIIHLT